MVDVALSFYFLSLANEPQLRILMRFRSHQGSQGQQVSGPETYPEQGIEAFSPASGFSPHPYLQRASPDLLLSPSAEARSNDLYPVNGEGASTALFLSTS